MRRETKVLAWKARWFAAVLWLVPALWVGPAVAQDEVPASMRREAVERELLDLLAEPSVVGREGFLTKAISRKLEARGLGFEQDVLGNVVVRFESGEEGPSRLIATPIDDPGFVVSHIDKDGYLRIVPVGRGRRGELFDQFHEGQKVQIWTATDSIYGAVAIPSTHLDGLRDEDKAPFTFKRAYIDVGAESASEARDLGVQLMAPVTLEKRAVVLSGGTVAGFGTRTRALVVALLHVCELVSESGLRDGSLVVAFHTLETLNRKGLESTVERYGPFDQVRLLSRYFGYQTGSSGPAIRLVEDLPDLGSGVLEAAPGQSSGAIHLDPGPSPGTRGPHFQEADVRWLGLPSRFPDTPVEMVSLADVVSLEDALIRTLEVSAPVLGRAEVPVDFQLEQVVACQPELERLVSAYGVSGFEAPVRSVVADLLPEWAVPTVDDAGNLTVQFGAPADSAEHEVFVAHLDEVGFVVDRIQEDGRLQLAARGGFDSSLWEAQAARIHNPGSQALVGVIEPRADYFEAQQRSPLGPLIVDIGAHSKQEAQHMGVVVSQSSVTMPKAMRCLGRHRALARGFDDRVGSAALILALRRIDPLAVRKRFTFAWSTEEESGLVGSTALARALSLTQPSVTRVYPIDTHVSSDSPIEERRYAFSRLGGGAVLRALESINFVPQREMERVLTLAEARGIPLQVAMTHGGTDGQSFLAFGAPSVPLSWPGRYSHSPVEVMDLRDLESLVELIVALVETD